MTALMTFLLVVLFSIVVVRIGTVALKMTGLSRDVAAFQAQSAFSGVGFTTSESEYVVSHPVRRRIIRILMLLGSAGLTSAMATLVLTFVGATPAESVERAFWLGVGLLLLLFFGKSKLVDRGLSWIIERALEKFTQIKIYDYEQLLGLSRGYTISMIKVKEGSWLANRKLRDLKLNEEGVLVLAIYRKVNGEERFIGAPRGDTIVIPGDTMVCYGPEDTLLNLPKRLKGPIGDKEHVEAVIKEKIREKKRELTGGYD